MAYTNHHVPPVFTATESAGGLELSPAIGSPGVDGQLQCFTIPSSSIICILSPEPNGDDDGDETYTLLYVPVDPPALNEAPIKSPPQTLLDRYLFREVPPHLNSDSADVLVLVSTTSGGGTASSYYSNVVRPLLEILKISAELEETTSPSSISDCIAARSAPGTRPQTILLLSGDTGIFDAINSPTARSAENITLAVFPLGTGNAFASSVHLSRGFSPLHSLLFGTPHQLPTFRARFAPGSRWVGRSEPIPEEGFIGAVVVSWGFHAALVADSESLRGEGIGIERFKIAAQQNLERIHEYQGRVSILPPNGTEWRSVQRPESKDDDNDPATLVDDVHPPEMLLPQTRGRRQGDPHFYALATMCSNLEEAFRISPSSKLGERLIRVVHFPPMDGEEVMSLMSGAYNGGTHVDDERVGYEVAMGVRIDMAEDDERWRRVCVDGGTVVLPEGGWVECTVMGPEESLGLKVLWIDE